MGEREGKGRFRAGARERVGGWIKEEKGRFRAGGSEMEMQ